MLIFTIETFVPDDIASEQLIEQNIAAEAVTLDAHVINVVDFDYSKLKPFERQVVDKEAIFEQSIEAKVYRWQKHQASLIHYRTDDNQMVSKAKTTNIYHSSGGLSEANKA